MYLYSSCLHTALIPSYHIIPLHRPPYYLVLCYTILYYTLLNYAMLYYTILYYAVLYFTELYTFSLFFFFQFLIESDYFLRIVGQGQPTLSHFAQGVGHREQPDLSTISPAFKLMERVEHWRRKCIAIQYYE